MAPAQSAARAEREKMLKAVVAFASGLTKRFEAARDVTLPTDIETQIRGLPLQPSSTVTAKRDELDCIGTELWNLSTRLRREEPQPTGKNTDDVARKNRALCLLRIFSFLLLDSASGQSVKACGRKICVRLMKVALKAAKVCIASNEAAGATKVLERAAEYEEVLSKGADEEQDEEGEVGERLRVEYFAMRTTLAWRQDRMDTAEHMFAKCKQLTCALTPSTAESLADLLYEIGKDLLGKRNYELGIRWLERAHDMLGEQDLEVLSAEAGELRLSIMQSIVQGYMKLKVGESRDKARNMIKLLEADYEDKMAVSLLKLELMSTDDFLDHQEFYSVIHRIIRTAILNDKNFKTIMHHIHKIKDHNNFTACKLIDELINIRLFREENDLWIEKAFITRIWICCSTFMAEDALEQLQELFNTVAQNMKGAFSPQATHAGQTLLWKRVEAICSQEQYQVAEGWCNLCLHPLFEKAGDVNKSKIARKLIQCAQARHDHASAREVFSKMSDSGRDDRITRYLMYKTGLHLGDPEFLAECLDVICRQSTKDATLLYACILEAQTSGNKRHAIAALEKVLVKYDYSAPADVHLPALLRLTTRLLGHELVVDGQLNHDILTQICKVLEGACDQAKASRRRPSTPAREQFTSSEFEWFSKNAYNWSIKYCAEMQPTNLVRLLNVCIEFIKLLKEHGSSGNEADLSLRLMFCNFLATCAYTTLARAEDIIQDCLQYYLKARLHGKTFRDIAVDSLDKLSQPAQADMIAKHYQVVKLELEAALKLEQWDEMDELFGQCFKFENPQHLETLADLVLVTYSCITKANLDGKYQTKILSVLQKIINISHKQNGCDMVKLSRWIRCLFQLALTFDESISLRCVDQAITIAAPRQRHIESYMTPPLSSSPITVDDMEKYFADDEEKERNHYPITELEWLSTTAFNHAVDYYIQENDTKCKEWAEKALALAGWAEDEGQLRGVLLDKYKGLAWSEDK